MSDLVFLFVIFWSFMAGGIGWQRLLLDADTGLHTRIGDYVLAHHAVPTHDLFAFSRPGQEWFAFEWGTETLFGFLHGQFGMKGLVLLCGLAIGACFAILFRYALWRGANALIALALVLIAVNGSSFNFHARPHVLTLLLLSGAIWLVERDRRERTRLVWLLVPLTALWANLHGGFLMFLALVGILALGSVIERRWSDAIRYGMLAAACGAASLANPYGIRLHLHILETMQSEWIMNTVGEFKSPVFRDEWMMDFMLLLFLGLACLVPLLQKRKFTESLWILFLAYESLHSVRHAPIFMLIAVPIVACELTGWWKSWVEGRDRKSVARILEDLSATVATRSRASSIWIPVAVIALAFTSAIDWPAGFSDEEFPIHIIDHHAAQIASARIFTTDQWADYLIYRNYPTQRVFMDSRHNYYGPKIGDDYMALLEGRHNWREVIDRYRLDLILCSADAPLASLVKVYPGWRVLEDDGKAVLFERRVQP